MTSSRHILRDPSLGCRAHWDPLQIRVAGALLCPRDMHGVLFSVAAAATAKSLQSCPTLCDPIDGSPPGSPVPGILQARTLEWVALAFSNAGK